MAKPSLSSDTNDFDQLCFFVEIAKVISRSNTMKEIMASVMDQICAIFDPQNWSLLLKEPGATDLKFVIAIGENVAPLKNSMLPAGEGIAGWIMENRLPVIIEDVAKDPRFSDRADKITGVITRSIIGVPIVSRDCIFGVIELINKTNSNTFTAYELKMLTTIADFAAIAIEKAYYCNTLKKLARSDPLTGLYNRGSFEHFLNSELESHNRHGTPLSLLMIDVDEFKQINDTFGHPAGDEVLKTLATIIRATIRSIDKPCRYGGDEFIIILPNTQKTNAERVRSRIKDRIGYVNAENNCPQFSVSIGQYVLCDDDDNDSPILSLLDSDLYHEKEKKKHAKMLNTDIVLTGMANEKPLNK